MLSERSTEERKRKTDMCKGDGRGYEVEEVVDFMNSGEYQIQTHLAGDCFSVAFLRDYSDHSGDVFLVQKESTPIQILLKMNKEGLSVCKDREFFFSYNRFNGDLFLSHIYELGRNEDFSFRKRLVSHEIVERVAKVLDIPYSEPLDHITEFCEIDEVAGFDKLTNTFHSVRLVKKDLTYTKSSCITILPNKYGEMVAESEKTTWIDKAKRLLRIDLRSPF
jgi:hypothetical protein